MSRPIKLLFDECLTGPVVRHLHGLLSYTNFAIEVKLLPDFIKRGTHDDSWIPQIKHEGWIVVTGDSGKGGTGKGTKLPLVCAREGVTHIMLSGRLQQKTGFEKARAFMSVWEEVCSLLDAPSGSGWLLKMTGARSFALVSKPPPVPKPHPH